jgi:hypothetical protein
MRRVPDPARVPGTRPADTTAVRHLGRNHRARTIQCRLVSWPRQRRRPDAWPHGCSIYSRGRARKYWKGSVITSWNTGYAQSDSERIYWERAGDGVPIVLLPPGARAVLRRASGNRVGPARIRQFDAHPAFVQLGPAPTSGGLAGMPVLTATDRYGPVRASAGAWPARPRPARAATVPACATARSRRRRSAPAGR